MLKNPVFSILIPYHNSDKTIAETLASIDAQEQIALEIIIADDRSNPQARNTIERFAKEDPRIRIVNAMGRGPSAARNTAVSVARGEFFCFLDADDCLRDGALNAYLRFFRSDEKLGVAFGQVRITANPAVEGGVITPHCPTPTLAQIIGENRVCTSSNIVARREAFADIGGFDETLSHAEDQEWLARAWRYPGWSIKGLGRVTLDYRTSHGGLSSDLRKMETGWRRMIEVVNAGACAKTNSEMSESHGLFYRYLARRALRLGASRKDGMFFMLRALASHPSILYREIGRTWPTLIGAVAVFCVGPTPFQKIFR